MSSEAERMSESKTQKHWAPGTARRALGKLEKARRGVTAGMAGESKTTNGDVKTSEGMEPEQSAQPDARVVDSGSRPRADVEDGPGSAHGGFADAKLYDSDQRMSNQDGDEDPPSKSAGSPSKSQSEEQQALEDQSEPEQGRACNDDLRIDGSTIHDLVSPSIGSSPSKERRSFKNTASDQALSRPIGCDRTESSGFGFIIVEGATTMDSSLLSHHNDQRQSLESDTFQLSALDNDRELDSNPGAQRGYDLKRKMSSSTECAITARKKGKMPMQLGDVTQSKVTLIGTDGQYVSVSGALSGYEARSLSSSDRNTNDESMSVDQRGSVGASSSKPTRVPSVQQKPRALSFGGTDSLQPYQHTRSHSADDLSKLRGTGIELQLPPMTSDPLMTRTMQSLRPGQWLNTDSVLSLIKMFAPPNIHVVDPDHLVSHTERGANNRCECNRYLKSTKVVITVFNQSNVHWLLFIGNRESRTYELYDPYGDPQVPHHKTKALCKQLDNFFMTTTFTAWAPSPQGPPGTVQSDNFNCGIFVIIHAIRRMNTATNYGGFHPFTARHIFATIINSMAKQKGPPIRIPSDFDERFSIAPATMLTVTQNPHALNRHILRDSRRILAGYLAAEPDYNLRKETHMDLLRAIDGVTTETTAALEGQKRVLSLLIQQNNQLKSMQVNIGASLQISHDDIVRQLKRQLKTSEQRVACLNDLREPLETIGQAIYYTLHEVKDVIREFSLGPRSS